MSLTIEKLYKINTTIEHMNNLHKKSKLQLITSTFVIMTGLFVTLTMGNSITGNVTGSRNLSAIEIIVAMWGILIIIAGFWMLRKKDFHRSIFD